MTKHEGKISVWNSKRLLRKLEKKILGTTFLQHYMYMVAQKSKPLQNYQNILLNRIKACQEV